MRAISRSMRRNGGFSLVELMVGVVISLLAVLVITQVFTLFESRKRSASGAADAQTSGALAMFAIERDIRMAGYGLSQTGLIGCTINRWYDGTLLPSLTLKPASITKGSGGVSDSIRVSYSSKGWSVPARVVTEHPQTANNIFLNTTLGIAVGDMMVAYESGKDCTLFQVTGISGNSQIHHSSGKSKWNPPGGHNIFPSGGYSTNALVFNFGDLVDRSYSIDANNNLKLSEYSSDDNTSTTQTVVPNIVALRMQYGFDTRADPRSDARVDTWSDTVIDADGNKTVGDHGDVQRIYAIRLAVVARNAVGEKPKADGTCDYYDGEKPALKKPAWTAVNAATAKLESIEIDVSKNHDGSFRKDWQCYRYKTFQTIIPLRNRIWSQS